MKFSFSLKSVLILLQIPCVFVVKAETEVVDGITWTYKIVNGKTASVGLGSSSTAIPTTTAGAIEIPSRLGGYPVTCIEYEAFNNCRYITSVTIPSSIMSIRGYAFNECSSLNAVYIDDLSKWFGINFESNSSNPLHYANNLYMKGELIKNLVVPDGVTNIGDYAFNNCYSIINVMLSNSVTNIGRYAFFDCISLERVVISESVTSIGDCAFLYCDSLRSAEFRGEPPAGIKYSLILDCGVCTFQREHGEKWKRVLASQSKLGGFIQPNRPVVEYVSVKVRESNPTILDCVYRVNSGNPTVKVRALAFKDGVRSFANVVRPETFIEGTAANVGDAVAANTELKLSWQVSADWDIDLAKVKFEILATEDELLPLELRTIPANGSNKAMEFSWNAITKNQVFDALLWLYADKDGEMMLADGVLKNGSTILAKGDGLYGTSKYISGKTVYSYTAPEYVFRKMGFLLLDNENLTYARTLSRLELIPDGIRQYCYRWTEQ